MKISQLIKKEFVWLDLTSTSKHGVIEKMIQMAKGHPYVSDYPTFCKAMYERESAGSTSIGYGVAIPHARTDQVKDLLLVIGRLTEGIQFEQTDKIPVRLIFMVGTPKNMVTEYLRLVGTLARHLKTESLRQKLLTAPDAETLINAFVESENQFP